MHVYLGFEDSRFSHAGICVDQEYVVDADNRGPTHKDIDRVLLTDFFSPHNAPGGGRIRRYVGPRQDAHRAARWAEDHIGQWHFSFMDPLFVTTAEGSCVPIDCDSGGVYCSAFVWRAYRDGAGVDIVEMDHIFNALDPANVDRVLDCIVRLARTQDPNSSDEELRQYALFKLRSHGGLFITPGNLDDTNNFESVCDIDAEDF